MPHFEGLWEATERAAIYNFYQIVGTYIFTLDEIKKITYEMAFMLGLHPLYASTESREANEVQNVKQGKIVIVKKERLSPLSWPLGRIVAFVSGLDGTIRIVVVRGWSDKYLASKRKTKIVGKLRFISQHNLPSARYT